MAVTMHKSPFVARLFLLPLSVILVLWITASREITPTSMLYAGTLCLLPWMQYCKWGRGNQREFPLFPLIGGTYLFAFVLPLFWGDHGMRTYLGDRFFSAESLQPAMLLAVLGVASLWIGMESPLTRRFGLSTRFEIGRRGFEWNYLRLILLIGTVINGMGVGAFGEGGRQTLVLLQTVVPTTAFALLFRTYLRGAADRTDKAFLLSYVIVRFLIGMSSGWLGAFVGFLVVCVAVYVYERRKFPIAVVPLILLFLIFFQPGKNAFRQAYWLQEKQASMLEKVSFWFNESLRLWMESGADPEQVRDLSHATMHRLSLLEQTANVLELTPSVVPHQQGKLYSYLGVTFVPRFLWPDKPTFSAANQWYQVAYGITAREDLGKVSIAVGHLTESYISFGWLGPPLIMLVLGVFLGWIRSNLMSVDSGIVFNALGVALLPNLLAVESQMAQYVSGLMQAIALTLIVMLPVIKRQPRYQYPEAPSFSRAPAVTPVLKSV